MIVKTARCTKTLFAFALLMFSSSHYLPANHLMQILLLIKMVNEGFILLKHFLSTICLTLIKAYFKFCIVVILSRHGTCALWLTIFVAPQNQITPLSALKINRPCNLIYHFVCELNLQSAAFIVRYQLQVQVSWL